MLGWVKMEEWWGSIEEVEDRRGDGRVCLGLMDGV